MTDLVGLLTELNVALAAAAMFVLMLRRPFRRIWGPRAAYGLWAILPTAMASVCLPRPGIGVMTEAALAPWATAIVSVWLAGVLVSVVLIAAAQARFAAQARRGLAGPAITGVLIGRLVMPADSATRWTPEELAVVRAHERAHRDRGDLRINAVVAVLRCLFWANPLAQIAADRFRFDQELACDATVMAMKPGRRRLYAEALLKAVPTSPLALGCSWSAIGVAALETRMASLKLNCRRPDVFAMACVTVLALTMGAAAWRIQPASLQAAAPASPAVLLIQIRAPSP